MERQLSSLDSQLHSHYALAASTLGWSVNEEEAMRSLFLEEGIRGIEITPDRILNSKNLFDPDKMKTYVDFWTHSNVSIVSMQGILYPRDDFRLFESSTKTLELFTYVANIIDVAHAMNIPHIVFGSGNVRKLGPLSPSQGDAIAIPFFRDLAQYAQSQNVAISIEPLTKEYGSEYLCTTKDALRFVETVNHPSFGINVDTAVMLLSNDVAKTIVECGSYIKHVHVSEPLLVSVENISEQIHSLFAGALSQISYSGYLSIEMKRSKDSNVEIMRRSVNRVKKIYEL